MLTRQEHAIDRLARQARMDTLYGGFKAAQLAKRMDRINPKAIYEPIVCAIYAASTGRRSERWEMWECPECGEEHLGHDAALACCCRE